MCRKAPTREVWVVSWVYWQGDEQSGGGFQWFYDREAADRYFTTEREGWVGATARIRLVPLDVPAHLFTRNAGPNQAVTDWIDADIDRVEDHHLSRAVRVALEVS